MLFFFLILFYKYKCRDFIKNLVGIEQIKDSNKRPAEEIKEYPYSHCRANITNNKQAEITIELVLILA